MKFAHCNIAFHFLSMFKLIADSQANLSFLLYRILCTAIWQNILLSICLLIDVFHSCLLYENINDKTLSLLLYKSNISVRITRSSKALSNLHAIVVLYWKNFVDMILYWRMQHHQMPENDVFDWFFVGL